ncbi:MAG: sulfurtransferase-like selenium metabolism protein YedF [Eubacteriaceae bacterium]
MIIDAIGKNCPIPVIMAKKEIDNKERNFSILVDNFVATENLKKLGQNNGYHVKIENKEPPYTLHFSKDPLFSSTLEDPLTTEVSQKPSHWALFLGKDLIGEGDSALGESLMKMYFYTLTQSENIPEAILLMNNGVKLATINEQVIEHLKVLEEKGSQILVCGACLDFYQLSSQLKVGRVSNMFSINEVMVKVSKVITL